MFTQYLKKLPENWLPAEKVFSALGDPVRQKILLIFEPGEELSIKDIASAFPLSRTAMVHHLNVLEQAGILSSRRRGKESLYSLHPEKVLEAIENLRLYIEEVFPDVHKKFRASLPGNEEI